MDRLDELKQIAAKAREKKWRMDAAQRNAASELLSGLLKDAGQEIDEALRIAEDLHSEAFADGIGKAWPQLSSERRIRTIRSLSVSDTERSQRRTMLVALRLSDEDGAAAAELLDRLIPDSIPTKELRDLLMGTILRSGQHFKFMGLSISSDSRSGSKVIRTLSRLAFDPGKDVDQMVRFEIARAATAVLGRGLIETPQDAELLRSVVAEVKRWPNMLRDQFGRWVNVDFPTFSGQLFASDPSVQQLAEPPMPAPQTVESPKDDVIQDLETYFAGRIDRLEADLKAAARAHQLLRETREREKEEVRKTKAKEQSLAAALRDSESARSAAECAVESAHSRLRELEGQIRQLYREREQEREKLTQQITANANGRIGEFQQQLAMTLARQLSDLPPKDMRVSPELGAVLLLQFYQLIDLLAQHGIVLPLRTQR